MNKNSMILMFVSDLKPLNEQKPSFLNKAFFSVATAILWHLTVTTNHSLAETVTAGVPPLLISSWPSCSGSDENTPVDLLHESHLMKLRQLHVMLFDLCLHF